MISIIWIVNPKCDWHRRYLWSTEPSWYSWIRGQGDGKSNPSPMRPKAKQSGHTDVTNQVVPMWLIRANLVWPIRANLMWPIKAYRCDQSGRTDVTNQGKLGVTYQDKLGVTNQGVPKWPIRAYRCDQSLQTGCEQWEQTWCDQSGPTWCDWVFLGLCWEWSVPGRNDPKELVVLRGDSNNGSLFNDISSTILTETTV